MLYSASGTTRVFLVRGVPPCLCHDNYPSTAESLSFTELPRLPISSVESINSTTESSATEARPLVSPMLHLGRQSPLLRTALNNSRRWSRKLLELTTWYIHGLPTGTDAVRPIDDTSLPFAGVRVRLCGTGGSIRVIPRRVSAQRGIITLGEPGASAWLQHGDVLEFGSGSCSGCGFGVRLCFLAVHVRTSPTTELAQNASYVWVKSASDAVSGTPVAMWSARFTDWTTIPKTLKAKMLLETVQLIHQKSSAEKGKENAKMMRTCTSVTTAASTDAMSQKQQTQRVCTDATNAGVDGADGSPAPPSFEEVPRYHNINSIGRSTSGSEARQDACTAACDAEEDAATPTSESQQRLFQNRGLTRSAPDVLHATSESRFSSHLLPPQQQQERQQRSLSQGRSPPLRCTAPPPRFRTTSTALSGRNSVDCGGGSVVRYSCATSETMDDKLHAALLNLENGGTEIGEALLHPPPLRGPAVLLGAIEEEENDDSVLSGAHHALTRTPSRCEEAVEEDQKQERESRSSNAGQAVPQQVSSRRSTKRGGRCGQWRRSVSRRSGRDGEAVSPPKRRRTSPSASTSTPQSTLRRDGEADGVAAPPLTRADIKRLRTNQSAQEDSQVVFFDH